jgi:hypothetical protein
MRKTRRINAAVACVESLESRRMLSAALPMSKAVPVDGGLELRVLVTGSMDVEIASAPGGLTVESGSAAITYTGDFVQIDIRALYGNNDIVIDPSVTVPAQMTGGNGSDTLVGGGGTEQIDAGKGADSLVAGSGTDTVVALNDQKDSIVGGTGEDSFWVGPNDKVADVSAQNTALGAVHKVNLKKVKTAKTVGSSEPSIGLSGVTYQDFSSDPLFSAAGPSANDIIQGDLGDCYFLATLAAIAKADPSQIRQDIVQTGPDAYMVEFHSGSTPEYVSVDGELPAYSDGQLVYAGLGQGDSIWVAILEKAFAVYRDGDNSYQNIASGWMDEVYEDLGLNSSDTYAEFAGSQTAFLNTIAEDLAKHQAVTAGVIDVPSGVPLISDHAYSVDSVTVVDGVVTAVTLRNPWGTVGVDGLTNGGYVTLTAAQAYDGIYAITSAAA